MTHTKETLMKPALLVSLSVAALALAGCADFNPAADAQRSALGIVATSHANSARLSPQEWASLVGPDIHAGTYVVVGSDDGAPQILGTAAALDLPKNPKARADRIAELVSLTANQAATANAQAPETDPIAAINAVVRALDPNARQAGCDLIVAGSGLSTAGVLDMQVTSIAIDPADAIAALEASHTMPALDGCAVTWVGLGSTAGDQARPGEADIRQLEALWTSVLSAGGATKVTFVYDVVTADPPAALPHVSDVAMTPPSPPPAATQSCTVDLTDARVGFVPDKAMFIDPPRAKAAIAQAATQLSQCPTGRIAVTATTSSAGSAKGRLTTSQERAEAVAAELATALGIPVSSISATGVGFCEAPASPTPVCANDTNSAGALMLEPAQANRRAIITATSN